MTNDLLSEASDFVSGARSEDKVGPPARMQRMKRTQSKVDVKHT